MPTHLSMFLFMLLAALTRAGPFMVKRDNNPTIDAATFGLLVGMRELAGASYCDMSNGWHCLDCDHYPNIELIQAFTTPKTDTVGYVAVDNNSSRVIVAFRGSVTNLNWFEDFKIDKEPYTPLIGSCDECEVHSGFAESWTEASSQVLNLVWNASLANPSYEIVVVGHSLGGAIATLCAHTLAGAQNSTVKLYTFGEPRVGNKHFAHDMDAKFNVSGTYITPTISSVYRTVHYVDPVPRLPLRLFGYRHHGTQFYDSNPQNASSTPFDIQVCYGDEDSKCSDPNGIPNIQDDRPIHSWYLNARVNQCAFGN